MCTRTHTCTYTHTHTMKWPQWWKPSCGITQTERGLQTGDAVMKNSRYSSWSITLLASSVQPWKQTFCRLHFKFRFLTSSPGPHTGHSDGQVHMAVFSSFSFPLICALWIVFTHSSTESFPPTSSFSPFNSWKWIRSLMTSFKRES